VEVPVRKKDNSIAKELCGRKGRRRKGKGGPKRIKLVGEPVHARKINIGGVKYKGGGFSPGKREDMQK